MQRSSYLFTSESVSEGHPDKVCDRISDEVVDAFFRLGPKYGWAPKDLRVACETLATTNRVVIAGETRGPDETGKEPLLGPDAKSQVTVRYENGQPVEVPQIVVSTQHLDPKLESKHVRDIIEPYVRMALPDGWLTKSTVWHVNPTGAFVVGGPDGDCGLTGRKIIVDTYGGASPHGGGAFSGKDPTKVDRSAAYAARYLAKNVVAAGLADRCAIQLAYAIGVAKPLALYVDFYGTGQA